MNYFMTVAAGSIGAAWCMASSVGAVPLASHTPGFAKASEQTIIRLVDSVQKKQSQKDGIVNERSTGNEPFMGPGASGGPTHSAPGATENTVQQQSGDMKQSGSASDKSSAPPPKQGRPSESNPITQRDLERNAEQGGGAAVAAEVLKEEDKATSK